MVNQLGSCGIVGNNIDSELQNSTPTQAQEPSNTSLSRNAIIEKYNSNIKLLSYIFLIGDNKKIKLIYKRVKYQRGGTKLT